MSLGRECLYGLDLFRGCGGISLALQEWVRPIAYCEIDRYAQGVLLSRMGSGDLPTAPIWDDVKTLDGERFKGKIDIIYGGFPCQDISVAGNGKGLGGERSGLFFEVCRLVKEIAPSFIFLENVPAIRTRGLREVVISLTNMGYDCRWTCISAKEIGAPHIRKRWFLLAHSKCESLREQSGGRSWKGWTSSAEPMVFNQWETKPNMGRMVDGCTFRVDRIKTLGNGVVPAQVKEAFERLIGLPSGLTVGQESDDEDLANL